MIDCAGDTAGDGDHVQVQSQRDSKHIMCLSFTYCDGAGWARARRGLQLNN